jgi:hypothetical protein
MAELQGLKEALFQACFSKESHQPAFPCSSSPSPASGGNSQTAEPANEFNSYQILINATESSVQIPCETVFPLQSSTNIEHELVALI